MEEEEPSPERVSVRRSHFSSFLEHSVLIGPGEGGRGRRGEEGGGDSWTVLKENTDEAEREERGTGQGGKVTRGVNVCGGWMDGKR